MNYRKPKVVNAEVALNANELRGSINTDDDIECIINQTGITDIITIKRHLADNNNNVSSTILTLMDLKEDQQTCAKTNTENTVFDEIRLILNEKETIYQDVMKGNKNT
jgi:hypothetical protein